jgi:hypothetical protein
MQADSTIMMEMLATRAPVIELLPALLLAEKDRSADAGPYVCEDRQTGLGHADADRRRNHHFGEEQDITLIARHGIEEISRRRSLGGGVPAGQANCELRYRRESRWNPSGSRATAGLGRSGGRKGQPK